MRTTTAMREARISADVDISRFDCSMPGVHTDPIAAKMTEMPLFIDEAVQLLLVHGMIN